MSIFPSPKAPNPGKISYADLISKVQEQDAVINMLVNTVKENAKSLKTLSDRIFKLEASEIKTKYLMFVKDRVSDLLCKRISDLEQRSRRYCINVKGV